MKKDLAIIFGLFIVVVALMVFGRSYTSVGFINQASPSSGQTVRTSGLIPLSVKTLNIDAIIASKASDRKKGLEGRESLPLNQAMLFVFDIKGKYQFWMKDMNFAIDIIWIDENKRIVDIIANVPPEPGKSDKQLTRYSSRGDALYVLEINAGLSVLHGLSIGDQVNFSL